METTGIKVVIQGIYRGDSGIMDNKMEATIMGLY